MYNKHVYACMCEYPFIGLTNVAHQVWVLTTTEGHRVCELPAAVFRTRSAWKHKSFLSWVSAFPPGAFDWWNGCVHLLGVVLLYPKPKILPTSPHELRAKPARMAQDSTATACDSISTSRIWKEFVILLQVLPVHARASTVQARHSYLPTHQWRSLRTFPSFSWTVRNIFMTYENWKPWKDFLVRCSEACL